MNALQFVWEQGDRLDHTDLWLFVDNSQLLKNVLTQPQCPELAGLTGRDKTVFDRLTEI